MGDRKFTHALQRRGEAAKIRETVANQMKETSIQVCDFADKLASCRTATLDFFSIWLNLKSQCFCALS